MYLKTRVFLRNRPGARAKAAGKRAEVNEK